MAKVKSGRGKRPRPGVVRRRILREPAEVKYAEELRMARVDRHRPPALELAAFAADGPDLHPRLVAVRQAGAADPPEVLRRPGLVERAIVTLASDRGLLLIGDPGTGKSWLAELLAAAICGNSTHVVQGTAGTTEDHIKYSWNVAMVIAAGPVAGQHDPLADHDRDAAVAGWVGSRS